MENLVCQYCEKVCKNQNSLRNHERLCKKNPNKQEMTWIKIKGNTNCSCPECGKVFTTVTGLTYHKEIHKPKQELTCKFCGKVFRNSGALGSHIKTCKENTDKTIYKCEFCDYTGYSQSGVLQHQCYCQSNPNRKIAPKHTEETKKKLSSIRKNIIKDHPEYQQLWRYKKSDACEKLKGVLRLNGFQFEEEYHDNSWDRLFSLDIAFLPIKLDVEVNGTMHYNSDGTLRDYYKERHEYLESVGWEVVEFEYYKCYKNDEINNLIDMIKGKMV